MGKGRSITFSFVLRQFGFKKVAWDKCVQGFKESNYPCYSHEEKNIWCEVYLGDRSPYGWIVGGGINGTGYNQGKFFHDPEHLESILKQLK